MRGPQNIGFAEKAALGEMGLEASISFANLFRLSG